MSTTIGRRKLNLMIFSEGMLTKNPISLLLILLLYKQALTLFKTLFLA